MSFYIVRGYYKSVEDVGYSCNKCSILIVSWVVRKRFSLLLQIFIFCLILRLSMLVSLLFALPKTSSLWQPQKSSKTCLDLCYKNIGVIHYFSTSSGVRLQLLVAQWKWNFRTIKTPLSTSNFPQESINNLTFPTNLRQ